MSASNQILAYLANLPVGKPFSARVLRHLASPDNVRQILKRLVKGGEIRRVARGLFSKPERLPQHGESLPSVWEAVQALSQAKGETVVMHGAEAARQLQLTTQTPMRLVFYTSGNTRTLRIAHRTVVLKHVNPSRLVLANTVAGQVIAALRYLGRTHVTMQTLETLRYHLTAEEWETVFKEMSHMPAWMAQIFYHYQQRARAYGS